MGSPEHHEGFCVSLRPAGCCLSCPKCPTSWLWRWPDLPPVSLQTLWRTEKHCPVQGFWSCPRFCPCCSSLPCCPSLSCPRCPPCPSLSCPYCPRCSSLSRPYRPRCSSLSRPHCPRCSCLPR